MLVTGYHIDRRILGIDELEMKELVPRANAGVETFVLEGQREARQGGVEPDGCFEIGCPQLRRDVRYLH